MTLHELLLEEAAQNSIDVVNYDIPVSALKGLYCDGMIILDNSLETEKEKTCVLAEELGHHYFTVGDILNESPIVNAKQEKLARCWAYERIVPIGSFIEAYEIQPASCVDFSEYLGVTEDFLKQAIKHYAVKYGNRLELNEYVIIFSPLGVMKRV
ncbi:ImmA/IrrE family metallo-endopeptidase [Clostridia bacterium]|nr:ImmA/IrrE family metallo-endopeptidase [Clostridia bacterium]